MTETQIQSNARLQRAAIVCSVLFAFASIAAGGYFLLARTADRLIAVQAEREALAWANYISSELERV